MTRTSTQTLAEGLAEYYAANPALKRGAQLSPEARAFFHSHDIVHVLYGCGTSMPDEAIVKLASLFGTTGRLSVLVMLLACTPAMAQHKSPTEAQCRQMVSSLFQSLKSPPPETERDKKDARVLIERMEKILRDTRARGGSECDSWSEIGKMAARQ